MKNNISDELIATVLNLIKNKKYDEALNQLIDLCEKGPVFVHCVASVERSPLLCMAFLVRKKSLNPYQDNHLLEMEILLKLHFRICEASLGFLLP